MDLTPVLINSPFITPADFISPLSLSSIVRTTPSLPLFPIRSVKQQQRHLVPSLTGLTTGTQRPHPLNLFSRVKSTFIASFPAPFSCPI
jgi:hypothetical protein